MNVITMVAWNRPEYTRRVLEGLAACRGVEKYTLTVSVEPGCPEVEALFYQPWPFPVSLSVNETRLGTAKNTYKVLSSVFRQGVNFVIHMEDDVVPAPDSLDYFSWARKTYRSDPDVFSVTAYYSAKQHNLREPGLIDKIIPPEHWHTVKRRQWFTPWMWGTWRTRWEEMALRWVQIKHINDAWAEHINTHVRHNRYEVYPMLARSQNIGAENGIHVPSVDWHKEHQYNAEWAGKYIIPHGTFFELPPKPAHVQD